MIMLTGRMSTLKTVCVFPGHINSELPIQDLKNGDDIVVNIPMVMSDYKNYSATML